MSFSFITAGLYAELVASGTVEIKQAQLAELLYDDNDRVNPAIGMSNRQFMMSLTGDYVPSKEQVWRQWMAANNIKAEYDEGKKSYILTFIKERKRHGTAKADDRGSAGASGDAAGGELSTE